MNDPLDLSATEATGPAGVTVLVMVRSLTKSGPMVTPTSATVFAPVIGEVVVMMAVLVKISPLVRPGLT